MELMEECSPEPLLMGTGRMKYNKETRKYVRRVNMESPADTKKKAQWANGLTIARAYRPPQVITLQKS